MQPSDDHQTGIGSLQEDVQQSIEAYLLLAEEDGVVEARDRERRKRELLPQFEAAYMLSFTDLAERVAQALTSKAKHSMLCVHSDSKGFSAYRFNQRVMDIRKLFQQRCDLEYQSIERLRALYIQKTLRLKRNN